ncbi:MAG: helix-turn-helix domain-containing protein [Candidatus Thorarchaeota archaeon]
MISALTSKHTHKSIIIGTLTLALIMSILSGLATAQPMPSDILMTDTEINAVLGTTGSTQIAILSNVTNRSNLTLNYFDLRVDVRSLEILEAEADSVNASTDIVPGDRFSLIRVTPNTPLGPQTSTVLNLVFTTDTLQEQFGVCEDRDLCLSHVIYYLHPLNEIRDLRFTIALPQHAVLEGDSSAPLFPAPTSNYTDGTSLVFMWYTDSILPGQEQAYIVKYGLPMPVVTTPADSGINVILAVVLAAVGGAVIVLAVERAPQMIRSLRQPKEPRITGITRYEEEVLQLLKKKGGSSPQREIYEQLGISQSMASMVLTGLEERGVIKRFREGRENMVHLIE